jgi:ankyrin repeat protein
MINHAVKNGNHTLLREILSGNGPKEEGFSNHHDDGTIHQVDAFGDTPLIWACMKGDNEMIDILLGAGANIQAPSTTNGDTPLHRAVKCGHLHTSRHLLLKVKAKNRPTLNLNVNQAGMIPLHYAAQYGFDDIAELLMGMGGDPSIEDNQGKSSFDYAEQNDHHMMLALLRDPILARAEAAADAELEHRMKNNDDFLEACKVGNLQWATELLKGGANIEHRDKVTGNQALHYAAELEHKEVIMFLIKNGADPISKNKKGLTPLHFDTTLLWCRASLQLKKNKKG